jgi:hypothetical protein
MNLPTPIFNRSANSRNGETPNMGDRFSNGFRQVETMTEPIYCGGKLLEEIPKTNNIRTVTHFINLS